MGQISLISPLSDSSGRRGFSILTTLPLRYSSRASRVSAKSAKAIRSAKQHFFIAASGYLEL